MSFFLFSMSIEKDMSFDIIEKEDKLDFHTIQISLMQILKPPPEDIIHH